MNSYFILLCSLHPLVNQSISKSPLRSIPDFSYTSIVSSLFSSLSCKVAIPLSYYISLFMCYIPRSRANNHQPHCSLPITFIYMYVRRRNIVQNTQQFELKSKQFIPYTHNVRIKMHTSKTSPH